MNFFVSATLATLITFSVSAFSEVSTSAPVEKASVYFIEPADGQLLAKEFKVVFGLSHMGVAPAGTQRDNTGHHHLLIDTDTLPNLTQPLPATEKIKHFGGGQTETMLTLAPGTHTLQLLLGNYAHIPHSKPLLSKKITITVE